MATSSTAVTGNLHASHLNVKLHFKGGTNTVISGDKTGNINVAYIAPGRDGRTQTLVKAEDIDGSGAITGIAFLTGTSGLANATGVTVTLAHMDPSITDLETSFAGNVANATSATVVAKDATYHVPAGLSAGRFWIPFNNGSFKYNGSDNILVDITITGWEGNFSTLNYAYVPNTRIQFSTDPNSGIGDPLDRGFEPTFRFKGGSMDVIPTVGSQSNSNVFFSGSSRMYMYRNSELGTKGKINKFACRLYSAGPTVASTYTNLTVRMENTTADVLVDVFADNLSSPTTVFSGNFDLPAGLIQGDWIEIPFTTPFNYDGTSNIVVAVTNDSGTGSYMCTLNNDATLYLDQYNDSGSALDAKASARLWLK